MAESTKEQMNNKYKPSRWTRKTVADGAWMQKYTLDKLSGRDDFLADTLDNGVFGESGISGQIDTVKGVVDELNDDITAISSTIENLSPLTYRGNSNVADIKELTGSVIKNGDVYSITAKSQTEAMPKTGMWWYGDTAKSGDSDFKVKKNDEVAYTSADSRWFPIGQDIHVEYSAGENIAIDDDNTISVTDKTPLVFNRPITGDFNSSGDFEIGFAASQLTADYISATENTNDTTPRPITWYNTTTMTLNYHPSAYINSTTLYSPTHKGLNYSGTNATFDNISASNISSTFERTSKLSAGLINVFGNVTVNTATNTAAVIIGDSNGVHLLVDGDDIQAMNNTTAKNLDLNWYGGTVRAPSFSSTNLTASTATGNSANFTNITGTNINNYNINSLITSARNGQSAYNRLSQVASNSYAGGGKTFAYSTANYAILKDNLLSLPAGKSLLFIAAGNLYGNQGQNDPAIIEFALTTGPATGTRLQYMNFQCRLHDLMMRTSTYGVPNQVPFTVTFAHNNTGTSTQNIKFGARVTTQNGVGTVTANDIRMSWIIV